MADAPKKAAAGRRLDAATWLGLLFATSAIFGGFLHEGGRLGSILQFTAALIVFGGTLGATLVSTPWPQFRAALRRLGSVFFERPQPVSEVLTMILEFAAKARKNGLVALDADLGRIPDPFFRKALALAVDGADLQELQAMLELDVRVTEQRNEREARVFETAGGYSPTIGIIGAVLGLINVMKDIRDPSKVGAGIAVAFVATIYGVGAANIFYLPAATKIKARAAEEMLRREMVIEGVTGIVEGLNPKLIQIKLEAYLDRAGTPPRKASE
jgi:chemotaxis protein MotA